jgi:hypothetical protein
VPEVEGLDRHAVLRVGRLAQHELGAVVELYEGGGVCVFSGSLVALEDSIRHLRASLAAPQPGSRHTCRSIRDDSHALP